MKMSEYLLSPAEDRAQVMIRHKLIDRLKICRKRALENIPSTKAIGAHVCSGKIEHAQRDALHREFMRGKVAAYEALLKDFDARDARGSGDK